MITSLSESLSSAFLMASAEPNEEKSPDMSKLPLGLLRIDRSILYSMLCINAIFNLSQK
jgi:hypothetical protein